MKPRVKLAAAKTANGGEMVLYQHDADFSIEIDGQDLMHSRCHESEMALARLACAHLADYKSPRILIGGLGMGYTLRQALDILGPSARVVVGELMAPVVDWNRNFLGGLNDHPLEDDRVDLRTGDIVDLINRSREKFDAILLDVDNGPSALTTSGNDRLYNHNGIVTCQRALRQKGCLAVWSAEASRKFEQRLMDCDFHVRRFRVPAYKGSKSKTFFIFVASQDRQVLPPGGGELHRPAKEKAKSDGKQRKRFTRSRCRYRK